MVDLKSIRVFLSVVQHRSFKAASKDLGLAAASVTRIVAQLESDLGQQLLLRTTRQVGMTTFGAEVAARYRPLVEGFEDVTETLLRQTRPAHGHLRVSAPVSFGLQVLPDFVAQFRQSYPDVTLDIRVTDTLIDVIEEQRDLTIRVSKPPTDQKTIWRKLSEVPRLAVASPDFLARIGPLSAPEDLRPDWTMSYSATGAGEVWEFRDGAKQRNVRAGEQILSNNGDFLNALACQGCGIAVLPEFIVRDALARGQVVSVLPTWQPSSLWLTLAYPPYTQLPPLVGLFAERFEAFVAERARPDTNSAALST